MSGTIPFPDGGTGGPPERRTKMDILLSGIYAVLPANSLTEVQGKLKARGVDVSIPAIEQALFYLRRHANQYGWSVPHVKRGPRSDKRCYFAVLRDKDRRFTLPLEYQAYSSHGFSGTVSQIANLGKHETTALRMMIQFEKRKPIRDASEELIVDLEYISKKAKALLRRSANGSNG
jgi:hypothetical protein